ncbi:hypothetical protein JOE52_006706 [Bradyrhizobium canariense]|nr:hypothetical protein [Bradyrhizobium canariense]
MPIMRKRALSGTTTRAKGGAATMARTGQQAFSPTRFSRSLYLPELLTSRFI